MKNITQEITGVYAPEFLIAGYKFNSNFYLEHHAVNEKGQVLAGKPLDHDTVDGLLQRLTVQKKENEQRPPFGRVPENLFYMDNANQRYVWAVKSGPKPLYFKQDLNIPDGIAMIPNLIFEASRASLNVFAIKKIQQKSKLCQAPFHNTSSEGHVCQGSAKANQKDSSLQAVLDYWETIFFGSIFTHITGTSPISGNLNSMWKELIETGAKFDNSILIETKKTLEDLLK